MSGQAGEGQSLPPRPPALHLRREMELAPLFKACDRIESFAIEQFPHGDHLAGYSHQAITWTIVMRSLRTLDGLILLADGGYGLQAIMLARTLIEDCVTAWWSTAQDPADLLDLLGGHDKSVALRAQRDQPGRRYIATLAGLPTFSDSQLDEFRVAESIDPRRAVALWTKTNVVQMADEIAGHLTDSDRDILRMLVDVSYLFTNLFLHGSPKSMSTSLKSITLVDGVQHSEFSRQPSRLFVRDSLSIAFHVFVLMGSLVSKPSGRVRLSELVLRDRWLFDVDGAGGRKLGRNDPCPCGNGKKYKQCHGNLSTDR